MKRKQALSSGQRSIAYRKRLAASGEPPGYVVANAALAAVLEAKRNGEIVSPEDLLLRAADNVASDPQYSVDGVIAVVNRFVEPSRRRRRQWAA